MWALLQGYTVGFVKPLVAGQVGICFCVHNDSGTCSEPGQSRSGPSTRLCWLIPPGHGSSVTGGDVFLWAVTLRRLLFWLSGNKCVDAEVLEG